MGKDKILKDIKKLVKEYYYSTKSDLPSNKVPISGKVYDENELSNLVESALEGWWTEGRWGERLSNNIKSFLPAKHALLVNSGSSANFMALKILSSYKLGENRIKPGDEIITLAAGFPTTINPILDVQAVPVFVDVDIGTYNAKIDEIEKSITPKTKAIFLPHTLGNPFDVSRVADICADKKLWLIEDNCDAFGSKYKGNHTGTFGDISTLSFYPAHHITTGEGGAVITNNDLLAKIGQSVRDWGRDCWCPTGKDDTCKKRFGWKYGDLPKGYDHKYVYSEIGYNLKITDLQAAIGVAQMDKLPDFTKARQHNFNYLNKKLSSFSDQFYLPIAEKNSEPSWFGFLLTVKDSIDREEFMRYLNSNGIGTRLLFGGNITKQPYFTNSHIKYRTLGDLPNTDKIMRDTFWIGVYPGLNKNHLDYVCQKFKEFCI